MQLVSFLFTVKFIINKQIIKKTPEEKRIWNTWVEGFGANVLQMLY